MEKNHRNRNIDFFDLFLRERQVSDEFVVVFKRLYVYLRNKFAIDLLTEPTAIIILLDMLQSYKTKDNNKFDEEKEFRDSTINFAKIGKESLREQKKEVFKLMKRRKEQYRLYYNSTPVSEVETLEIAPKKKKAKDDLDELITHFPSDSFVIPFVNQYRKLERACKEIEKAEKRDRSVLRFFRKRSSELF